MYVPSTLPEHRKRKLKSQGSKINVSCTNAIIEVKNTETNEIFVTYYKTHDHKKEIQHIYISKNDQTSIAAKLTNAVTVIH